MKTIILLLISINIQAQVIRHELRPIDLNLPKNYNYCLYSVGGTFLLNETILKNNESAKYALISGVLISNIIIYWRKRTIQEVPKFEKRIKRKRK